MTTATDTLTITTCHCRRYTWFGPTTASISAGTTHAPEDCEAGS